MWQEYHGFWRKGDPLRTSRRKEYASCPTRTRRTNETKNTIRALQDEYDKAELHADTATLQRLLADDFLSIGPRGFILDKKEWINRHVHFKYHKLETSDMDIRLYDKSAIVRDIQRNKASYKDEPVELAVRVSQVWVDRQEEWRLAAMQFRPLTEA